MKRLFYLCAGMALGVYASHRLTRAAQAWTPAGVTDNAVGLGTSLRELAGQIRVDAARREAQLREAAGLDELPQPRKGTVVDRDAGGV